MYHNSRSVAGGEAEPGVELNASSAQSLYVATNVPSLEFH